MGLWAGVVTWYEELARTEPAFKPGNRYIDLGSQDVQVGRQEEWTSARSLVERLGLTYDCIDKDGRHGAMVLDINTCTQADVGYRYNVVANYGTTEHCFDQANCFRLVHDLCLVGGLMIHDVPAGGGIEILRREELAFYFCSVGLFRDLAEANGYEQVRLEIYGRASEPNGYSISAVLRKLVDQPFVVPIQRQYR